MPLSEISTFSVSRLEVLDARGEVDKALEPAIPDEELLALHRAMCLGREADARMLKLQRTGRLGTFPPTAGQEAVSVAAAFAVKKSDWFTGAFRELPGRLARGQSFTQLLKFWAGHEEGAAVSIDERTIPDNIVIASQIPQAVGIAYAMQLKGEDSVVLNFFGDGATSEGDFHEGLNFAAIWKSPVIFIIQNNGWAISTPRSKQTSSATLAQKAIAYDIPGIVVDGNDALAVYAAVSQAAERARKGEGPTLIEAQTYRMGVHTTADDPTRYRADTEVEEWAAKDPIPRFKLYLEGKGIWNDEKQAALDEEIKAEVAACVADFEGMEKVAPDAPFDHVLEHTNPELERQREIFLENIRTEFPEDLEGEADA